MEERKAKLVSQLAKLNGEILTSEEIPRSMSGVLLSPKPKRRRISDFNSMGLGTPKKGMGDRRTVSNMIRLSEEEEAPSMMSLMESDSSKVSWLLFWLTEDFRSGYHRFPASSFERERG